MTDLEWYRWQRTKGLVCTVLSLVGVVAGSYLTTLVPEVWQVVFMIPVAFLSAGAVVAVWTAWQCHLKVRAFGGEE